MKHSISVHIIILEIVRKTVCMFFIPFLSVEPVLPLPFPSPFPQCGTADAEIKIVSVGNRCVDVCVCVLGGGGLRLQNV